MNDITYVGRHTTMYTVSRHVHESWEYIYCTAGVGTVVFDDSSLTYKKGDEEARKRVVKRVSSSMGIRFRDGKEKSLETALQEDESSFKGTAIPHV